MSTTIIWFHLTTALIAFVVGSANLALAKGTLRHRVFGWTWLLLMLCVTVSSFWIRELNPGSFSWIHLLTVWTLISMSAAIFCIRTKRVRAHAIWMIGSMVGVAGAGAGAFAPGRFIASHLGY
ncbi:MAG: DUF2306 domain-containing protein [Rhodobacteraceae bacterium]|nr:DUF2306 domain-containing protein [Paracoccaceae bacterium]